MNSENETRVESKLPAWMSVLKDFIWIIGLVVIVVYKFQEQEAVNKTQDMQIQMMMNEHRQLYMELEKLNGSISELLIAVTTLKIQRESDNGRSHERVR